MAKQSDAESFDLTAGNYSLKMPANLMAILIPALVFILLVVASWIGLEKDSPQEVHAYAKKFFDDFFILLLFLIILWTFISTAYLLGRQHGFGKKQEWMEGMEVSQKLMSRTLQNTYSLENSPQKPRSTETLGDLEPVTESENNSTQSEISA